MTDSLPYSDSGATSQDVVKELTTLMALVGTVCAAGGKYSAQMIENTKEEPGKSILLQKMRVGLCLDSWAGGHVADLTEVIKPFLHTHFPEA